MDTILLPSEALARLEKRAADAKPCQPSEQQLRDAMFKRLFPIIEYALKQTTSTKVCFPWALLWNEGDKASDVMHTVQAVVYRINSRDKGSYYLSVHLYSPDVVLTVGDKFGYEYQSYLISSYIYTSFYLYNEFNVDEAALPSAIVARCREPIEYDEERVTKAMRKVRQAMHDLWAHTFTNTISISCTRVDVASVDTQEEMNEAVRRVIEEANEMDTGAAVFTYKWSYPYWTIHVDSQ